MSTPPEPRRPFGAAELWREVVEEFFSLDRGLPWTFAQLWVRPGATVRAWVDHRDPRVTRPIRYFLVAAAVAALSAVAVESRLPELVGRAPTAEEQAAARFAIEHLLLLNAATILATALAMRLVFRRARWTFVETLVHAVYAGAQSLWFNALVVPLVLVDFVLAAAIASAIAVFAYSVWFWASAHGGRGGDWLRALGGVILSQILVGALGFALGLIFGSATP